MTDQQGTSSGQGWGAAPGQARQAPDAGQGPGWGPAPGQQGQGTPGQPPGDWQHLPPEQVARMHRPGVVPLRPLYLGDIFGGALQTMRRNPQATIGLGFVVLAILMLPSLLLSLAATSALTGLSTNDLGLVVNLIGLLLSSLASVALTGMIVHVVGEAVLGDRAGLGETWRAVRGRLLPLIGVVLLLSIVWIGYVVVVALLMIALIAVTEGSGAGITGAVLLALGALIVALWAGPRLSLAPAPVVLERVGPWRGIRRAWALSRGTQAWRIVGITILAGLVVGIASLIISIPLGLLTLGLAAGAGDLTDPTLVSPLALVVDHLAQLVVGAFTIPFSAGVTALLYLDQRIRREGLALTLSRTAHERAARRSR